MTDLHVVPGDQLTAERWNALVDLASGKNKPLATQFIAPRKPRGGGSEIYLAKVLGNSWQAFQTTIDGLAATCYRRAGRLIGGGEIEIVAVGAYPRWENGALIHVWKNGDRFETLEARATVTITADARRTADGEVLVSFEAR